MTEQIPHPQKNAALRRSLNWLAKLVTACALSAWGFVLIDAIMRNGWAYVPMMRHWLGAHALYLLAGAVLGLGAWVLTGFEGLLMRRGRFAGAARAWVRALVYGTVAGAASVGTALWTFSGEQIGQTAWVHWGPALFVCLVVVGATVASWIQIAGFEQLKRGKRLMPALTGLGMLLVASGLIYVDLHAFVELYYRLHTLLELTASIMLSGALVLLLSGRKFDQAVPKTVMGSFAALLIGWTAVVTSTRSVRAWLDESLRHVWLEEVYLGRMLRRLHIADAFLSHPLRWKGPEMESVERLRARFDLSSIALSDQWKQAGARSAEVVASVRSLREASGTPNILIYYVDTLRSDVAGEVGTMPNVVKFAPQTLNFRRAYASGSDTLRSLPSITGGNYFVDRHASGDLLEVARSARHTSVLFIAKSAHEFLAKLRPTFKFEHTIEVEDYSADREVWGYGAEQPTAKAIVDKALGFLERSRNQPFFLWLFNFDQHNWRELDRDYIEDLAHKQNVSTIDPIWRYRVVAASIDAQFGRLLKGLERLGLSKKTIVVFVSDHGEALGRDGFWVHSVFLWESLVRVPLMLRIPGVEPRNIDEIVSLVDLAPTLAPYMNPTTPMDSYHGEDLLEYVLPNPPERRFPLLLSAASKEMLVRVGLIDSKRNLKLVLSLEAALPELYELRGVDPDSINLADLQPRQTLLLLNQLVRSPVFPRLREDFDLHQAKSSSSPTLEIVENAAAAEPGN